ncbi:uncharacterized protein LOC103984440 [Musa acuminata AAA Group]|uniref:uncharacterized protein LOC103984440 n=1 Tax=Musa acuminata AAA Group TaxID=214697 RepID=UPI0031CE86C1
MTVRSCQSELRARTISKVFLCPVAPTPWHAFGLHAHRANTDCRVLHAACMSWASTDEFLKRVTFHKLGFCSSLVCIRVPLLRLLDRKKGRSRLRQHRAPDFVASPLPMDPFSLPSSSSASSGQSAPSPEVLMDQLKSQLAQAYAEEFFETVRSKCFVRCIAKPGTSLSGSESSCISRCVDRYIEATVGG